MRAIGKQRRDRRLRVSAMPGESGAYGIALVVIDKRLILGKRSHVGILL